MVVVVLLLLLCSTCAIYLDVTSCSCACAVLQHCVTTKLAHDFLKLAVDAMHQPLVKFRLLAVPWQACPASQEGINWHSFLYRERSIVENRVTAPAAVVKTPNRGPLCVRRQLETVHQRVISRVVVSRTLAIEFTKAKSTLQITLL